VTDNLRTQLALFPDALAGHLVVTVIPLLVAVAVSVPLGVAIVRRPRLRGTVLTIVGLVQTVPGLALLALMVPALVALGALLAPLGIAVPALGPLPVLLALTLYAMLPIVRNTVAGIEGVDAGAVEGATGLGMTPGQVRRYVELPLAAPVVLAGIRTAAVWVVGMGTLATPVGQTSLGNYIFAGLQTRNVVAVLVGCVGAAGLALVVDGALGRVERSLRRRRPRRAVAALAALGVLLAIGVLAPNLTRRGSGTQVVVAGKPFTEQYVLVRLVETLLAEAGVDTVHKDALGSTVLLDALRAGEVDVAIDYSGTLWTQLGHTEPASRDEIRTTVCAALAADGVSCVGGLGFENAYALAVRRSVAKERGWTSIADLAADAPTLSIGSDYEFFQRAEWAAVREAYGLSFETEKTYDPTFLYEAVGRGEVDVATVYTTDGRVAAFDLVVLDDPRSALPPYDALLLVSRHAPERVSRALASLVGAVPAEAMREANRRVDVDGQTPDAVAAWLRSTVP
jgi:osmoprotectant transport system permease protein